MARFKSESRRNAILDAATEVIAEKGLGAPTSLIAEKAGVADGSLYTYFKSKDELLHVLYRELKNEMADAVMSGFPRREGVQVRLKYIWVNLVNWGAKHPVRRKVLTLINTWPGLDEESRKAGMAPFLEVHTMMNDAIAQSIFNPLKPDFFVAVVQSLSEMTINFMRQHPGEADEYRELGFETLWSAVAKKR